MSRSGVDPSTAGASTDAELFRELYPGLRRYAVAVSAGQSDPDDLVQEAVARVLRRGTLSALEDPGAYLRRAITNQASNLRRSAARGARAMIRSIPIGTAGDARPSDLDDLRRLAPIDRAVLYLSAVEGRTFAEIADALDLSVENARQRASRARAAMRAHLRSEEEN